MIPELRTGFNRSFSAEKYANLLALVEQRSGTPVDFRVAETPVFVEEALLDGMARMDQPTFTASELFTEYVQPKVAGHADQVPQYSPLPNSGHDYGDFIFVKQATK